MTNSPADQLGLGATVALDEWCLYGRLNEDGESRTIPLTPLPFRIGRRSGLSLSLSHQTVSGLHAEIDLRDQQLFVRDLHSTNGTFINGTQLFGEQEIFENDLLQFADVAFRVARRLPDTRSHTRCANASDQALALVQFDRLLEQGRWPPTSSRSSTWRRTRPSLSRRWPAVASSGWRRPSSCSRRRPSWDA